MKISIVDFQKYKGRRFEFDREIFNRLRQSNSDLIVAAGFIKILSEETVTFFKNKIINVHPALLPSFPGLKSQKQALDYGVKITGCTIHFIDKGVDTGPIILQKSIQIEPDIPLDELSRRILELEHQALPEAVNLFCQNKLIVKGRLVFIKK
jgi:phosphoribosylglycinamide formyltransferase-1